MSNGPWQLVLSQDLINALGKKLWEYGSGSGVFSAWLASGNIKYHHGLSTPRLYLETCDFDIAGTRIEWPRKRIRELASKLFIWRRVCGVFETKGWFLCACFVSNSCRCSAFPPSKRLHIHAVHLKTTYIHVITFICCPAQATDLNILIDLHVGTRRHVCTRTATYTAGHTNDMLHRDSLWSLWRVVQSTILWCKWLLEYVYLTLFLAQFLLAATEQAKKHSKTTAIDMTADDNNHVHGGVSSWDKAMSESPAYDTIWPVFIEFWRYKQSFWFLLKVARCLWALLQPVVKKHMIQLLWTADKLHSENETN